MTEYVGVNFLNYGAAGGNVYFYKTDIEGIKEGDLVVLPVRNYNLDFDGYALGVVVSTDIIDPESLKKVTKWVAAKVDVSAHEARVLRDKKREAIKLRMQSVKKRLEDRAIFEMLAEKSDEMKKLLKELEELGEE